MPSITQTTETDTACHLLADQQRRKVRRHVAGSEGTATVDQPVDSLDQPVDSLPTDSPPSADRGATRDRLSTTFHTVHLPMFREAGDSRYDPDRERIRYDSIDPVEEVLRACWWR
jgi:hypothetical protein